jgi:hypothetical protein
MDNGYLGVSPLLALIAFTIGNMIAIKAKAISPKSPKPNNKISGRQMSE